MLKMVKDNDDAEDLTIEAFGKAFRRLESYSPSFAFSTWLFKIATNNCIDFIRKQKMVILSIDEGNDQNSMDTAPSIQIKNDDLDPEEKIMLAQRSEQLKKILEQLNDKYRLMLEYRYFDELSYQEIAEKLDIPLGTVKAQIFRAKELLYEILKSNKSL
jgi:RNA polymerase sigma-70 factor (ECF subfamily)